jgi:hypothetical protein
VVFSIYVFDPAKKKVSRKRQVKNKEGQVSITEAVLIQDQLSTFKKALSQGLQSVQ